MSWSRASLALVLTTLVAAGPARADGAPGVNGIVVDGVKVNVVLPADYATSTARYPVVYLLHGYGENQDAWLNGGGIAAFAAGKEVIFVTPDGGQDGWYTDWRDGHHAWESFHIHTLIPYIDAHYRTWGTREGRAIAGDSMGGFGAMSYAARHPDLFVAAASFSGAVDVTDKSPVAELAISHAFAPKDDSNYAIWGDPTTDDVWWHAPNPTDLAGNLRGMSIYISCGDGVPEADDPANPTGMGGEQAVEDMARNFDAALTADGIPHAADYHDGLHTWKYWRRDLAAWWPVVTAAFGTPAPAPASFDYRAVEAHFSVWGWSFAADPSRAPEFLDVRNASAHGVTLTGSGTETVTTAADFPPGETVVVSDGTSSRSATADALGRITFTVDLGPPHTMQQYTAPERALDPTPGYFVTRTVTFSG